MTAPATSERRAAAPAQAQRQPGDGNMTRRSLMVPLLVMAAPFLFYLLPFLAGYGWSAIGPRTPTYPGMAASPERTPAVTTAVEYFGTGPMAVSFQVRLGAYLRDGELPLWNPYSGLGQPFAAQGEGSPYFPLSVVRSLLPAAWWNAVSFVMIGGSAAALFGFLRLLGLSPGAAAFGGAVWALSGQFTLMLARNNIVDQLAMIPPLFLAAAWAIASRRAAAYALFALVAGLHAMAGMLQIGVNTLLVLAGFLVVFPCAQIRSWGGRLWTTVTGFVFLGIGTMLAAGYVLPMVEAVQAAFGKNVPNLAFLTIPTANAVAFFVPLAFGQVFQSWIVGHYPNVVDWNNLYAHGSIGLSLLTVLALAGLRRARPDQRIMYLFFVGGLVFLLTRFMSVLPGSLVSHLPILSQQSPKHTNGVAVFCLVVTACFGVEWLRGIAWRQAVWLCGSAGLLLVGAVAYLVWQRGGSSAVDVPLAVRHVGVTAALSAMLLAAFSLACRARTDGEAATIVSAAAIGEASISLPLGNDDPGLLAARIGVGVLVVLAGVLAARRAVWPFALTGLAVAAAYAGIVAWPEHGLPKRVAIDVPPPYMRWLHTAATPEYRAFGIYADYSSIGEIQDMEVIGPLATNEWVAFVDLVSSPVVAKFHRLGSIFTLVNQVEPTIRYDLTADYPRARPLLDWMGVRFLVLDKVFFDGQLRDDHLPLLAPSSGLRVAYEDAHVTILESLTAQSKAFFTSRVREGSVATTLARLQADPRAIDGPVTVTADVGDVALGDLNGPAFPVPLAAYRPNDLRATFVAPGPGVFVVKDSFFPGWQATLNGEPAEVIQVNGLVRGVVVPGAGSYEVTMAYRPAAFTAGLLVAGAALTLVAAVLAWDLAHRRRRLP